MKTKMLDFVPYSQEPLGSALGAELSDLKHSERPFVSRFNPHRAPLLSSPKASQGRA